MINISPAILVVFILIGGFLGFGAGMRLQETIYREKSIKHKAAHYEMNELTGITTWVWNQ
jgi:hypothetical protein